MTVREWIDAADRRSDWSAVHVLVAGLGVSGFAAADALQHLGARVSVVESTPEASAGEATIQRATLLGALGVEVRLGTVPADTGGADLVVASPGFSPRAPIVEAALLDGIPVWGDVELAWRLRDRSNAAPWLCLTGTNGKTTTVQMLARMLVADGQRAIAAGNVGLPLCEVVMDPASYDAIAVELSSQQLYWTSSLSARAAAVLNIAPDHISWHGDFDAYAAAKATIYHDCQLACVYNVDDPPTRTMVEEAEVVEGCRAIGFTLGIPAIGMLGIVDGVLADRAFVEGRVRNAAELATIEDVPTGAPHNVANALAAAALARAHGVAARAVRDGLRGFQLDAHRIATVAVVDGVTYVDDSKATNPHAALASLSAFDSSVWIAGGLAKGASFDDLVARVRERLRAVVILGADRGLIAAALARHAPDVPVIELADTDTWVMETAVAAASRVAAPGDHVLLAPACASWDMFANYGARGDAFAAAVARLRDRHQRREGDG